MLPRIELDHHRCEQLASRAVVGDGVAWQELVEYLWPICSAIVRSDRTLRKMGRLDDRVRDVVTALMYKLGRDQGRGLKLYFSWIERHSDKTFGDWIRIATKNALRDYIRAELGEVDSDAPTSEPSPKRLLNEFARSGFVEERGVRPPYTAAQLARQLLEFAQGGLPPDQFRALSLWLDGAGFEEIAVELGLESPEAARNLVRAALAVLRRKFNPGSTEG